MEFIPKSIIAGVVISQPQLSGPQGFPSMGPAVLPRETINRIWSDVQREYQFQSLNFDQVGRGAVFVGAQGPEDMAIIQPPLIQVRSPYGEGIVDGNAQADKIQRIMSAILHHLPPTSALNLGVKVIFHAPAPGHDATAFLRTELIKGEEDLRALAGGSSDFEASIKLIIKGPATINTILVEPLHVDNAFLYVEDDQQFSGVSSTSIKDKVNDVNSFAIHQLKTFLESRAAGWAQ